MPFTNLGYANGIGYRGEKIAEGKHRADIRELTDDQLRSFEYAQQSAAPMVSETHGGEDVAIVAQGPWSHLYRGVRIPLEGGGFYFQKF